MYVTHCHPVNVEPRSHVNCTLEVPVTYNGSEVFVDPISAVIKPMGTIVTCNDIAPPRFQLEGAWYCMHDGTLRECHAPRIFPLDDLKIMDYAELGLGRSIYTKQQERENVGPQIFEQGKTNWVRNVRKRSKKRGTLNRDAKVLQERMPTLAAPPPPPRKNPVGIAGFGQVWACVPGEPSCPAFPRSGTNFVFLVRNMRYWTKHFSQY